MKNRFIILFIILAVFGGIGALLFFGRQDDGAQFSGTLNVWGVFDDPAVFVPIIEAYKARYPKSKFEIAYTKLDPVIYEQQLIDALAAGSGPDVFMFHNTWLPKHYNKVMPLGNEATQLAAFTNLYPTVVQQDFAPDQIIYGYPLYVDTLATYYNQDTFDAKGISLPPKTWTDLEGVIPRVREMDKAGRITKAAAALGGSNKSINRATDILSLLMLQSGTKMTDDEFRNATFDSAEGDAALAYYTKFANARDSAYTWNDSLSYSLDSFAAGETAVMFNYSHQVAFLKNKSPFLKFRVVPMLQPLGATSEVNFANYWGLVVSNKSANPLLAADFIKYLTADIDGSRKYLELSGRVPALRTLINEYISTKPDLGLFAKQALTARSWPEVDNNAIESIFTGVITDVNGGRATIDRALSEAASKVTDLMQRRAR